MSLGGKQIDELRAYAKDRKGEIAELVSDAADTIELLSAKLSAANMERSSQYYHDGWIPCDERMPLLDEYGYSQKVLVCFSNFSGCDICEYRKDEEQNGWYVGDSDDNPEDIGIHVVAWRPLPEPYKAEQDTSDMASAAERC